MKTLLCASAALALAGLSTAAQAQDAQWSGPYVGAHFGHGWQPEADDETIQFDTDLNGTFNNQVNNAAGANAFSPGFCGGAANGATAAAGCDEEEGGFEFGGHAGYDWQIGAFVIGGLVEASRTNVTDSVSAFSTTPASYTMTRRLKNLAAFRVRGGFAMGPTLVYATGGVASGDLQHRFTSTNTTNTFTMRGEDERSTGWQLGGGVEHMITPEVSLGLEYLYTSLEDEGGVVRTAGPAGTPFTTTNPSGTDLRRAEGDFESHAVRVKASYRF